MSYTPAALHRSDTGSIVITWDDSSETTWTAGQLRRACPCATCREKKRAEDEVPAKKKSLTLPVISAAEARPLRVEAMRPAGNYAYHISFSDGHDSGLFTMTMLRDGYDRVVAAAISEGPAS